MEFSQGPETLPSQVITGAEGQPVLIAVCSGEPVQISLDSDSKISTVSSPSRSRAALGVALAALYDNALTKEQQEPEPQLQAGSISPCGCRQALGFLGSKLALPVAGQCSH